jgi:hypothetical protein
LGAERLGAELWRRRNALQLFAFAGFCLPFVNTAARAAGDDNTTKGAAWLLGDDLSLAALLYNQGASDAMINTLLSKAKKIADIVGVEVKPFPAKTGDSTGSTADIIQYLIAGDGAKIGDALSKKYGEDHGILFEVAVKSNLLILLYAPGDSMGKTLANVIESRLQSINLPQNLWVGVVTLINNKGSADDVKDAVFKMHKDIANYFIPGSG